MCTARLDFSAAHSDQAASGTTLLWMAQSNAWLFHCLGTASNQVLGPFVCLVRFVAKCFGRGEATRTHALQFVVLFRTSCLGGFHRP